VAPGDTCQLDNAGPDTFGSCCRGRSPRVLMGDVHPEDARPNAKHQRRIEDESLTVDTGGDRFVGIDFECLCGPLTHGSMKWIAVRAAARGGPTTMMPSKPWSIRGRVPEPTARPSR
jgi:hypothetical protein